MITALTGTLQRLESERAHLAVGPIVVEILIAAADLPLLEQRTGDEITFYTSFYIEGDQSGGSLQPRLIGFLSARDRGFFQQFITVKGIGPRKALKALALPAPQVAHAIETRDTRVLVKLPQIGKRAAEQIIAELAGKVGRFMESGIEVTPVAATHGPRSDIEKDALAALVALGERSADADRLLDRVKAEAEPPATTDGLIRAMLRLRG